MSYCVGIITHMHIHTPSHWQNLHYFMDLETDSIIFYSLLRQFEETEFKSKAGHLQVPCSLSEGKRSSKGTRAQMYLLVVSYDTTLYKCNLRVGKASLASQSNFTVYHGGGGGIVHIASVVTKQRMADASAQLSCSIYLA